MAEQESHSQETGSPGATPPAYEAPAIVWEEALEVRPSLALACGKAAGPDCLFNGGITS